MLGRLEMDIEECIEVYNDLFEVVFGKKKKRSPLNFFSGSIQARFDSAVLEDHVKQVLKRKGFKEDALLNDGKERRCRV